MVKYSLNLIESRFYFHRQMMIQVESQLRGGITLIVHFLGAKELDNSKGGGNSFARAYTNIRLIVCVFL